MLHYSYYTSSASSSGISKSLSLAYVSSEQKRCSLAFESIVLGVFADQFSNESPPLLFHLVIFIHLVPHFGIQKLCRNLSVTEVPHHTMSRLNNPRGRGQQAERCAQGSEQYWI